MRRASDMLFAGYPSESENITGIPYRLCQQIPRFFPNLPRGFLEEGEAHVRVPAGSPYSELLLVGHSLGGVVLRRALREAAHHGLSSAKLMLSPAGHVDPPNWCGG